MTAQARRTAGIAMMLAAACAAGAAADDDRYAAMRRDLVRQIEADAAQTAFETGRPRFAARVMAQLERVPRHRFVGAELAGAAYDNRPLPIGHGQTISQPYIVALMTELLDPEPGDVVLEVGTGSGYQAAVLAGLVKQVYTVEIIEPLATTATARLKQLGYANVAVKVADGYHGWAEHAPYDGIVVTAASGSVPPPLIAQLKPGGRMVIPVGTSFFAQELVLVEKRRDGTITTQQILPVRFVPLTGKH
jgi:protein-L-isoaspartate(D-aspartate) O-methyltransferase